MAHTFDPYWDLTPGVPGGLLIKGDCLKFRVVDPALPPGLGVPNLVVDPTVPFKIELDWRISGHFSRFWLEALGGVWHIDVFAESIGPGPELRIAFAHEPAVPVPNPIGPDHDYSTVLTVPPSSGLVEHVPHVSSGVYKLVATIFLNSSIPGFDICGYCDGGMIKVAKP